MKYCPECASALELRRVDGVERKSCVSPECGFVHWDNPVPVVAAFIEYQGKILLARNSQWPEGMFSLVTGYLEKNETLEEAVVREVKEELGLDGKTQEFLAHWVVATGELTTGNEITEVKLLSREELRLWQFGRLALTSTIAKQWLEKTTPNMAFERDATKAARPSTSR
jgi:NAD+ diphosphatase